MTTWNPRPEDDDPSITPLAIPLLAGPGSITTVMVLTAEGGGAWSAKFVVLGAVIAILLLTGGILLGADMVLRRLGHTGMKIVEKLMGLMLARHRGAADHEWRAAVLAECDGDWLKGSDSGPHRCLGLSLIPQQHRENIEIRASSDRFSVGYAPGSRLSASRIPCIIPLSAQSLDMGSSGADLILRLGPISG